MKIHIACAFYRKHLLKTQMHYLEPMGIEWYPVCDAIDIEPFKDIHKDWVHPILCAPLDLSKDQAFRKFNDFIDSIIINDDDYYGFMGDDDSYEPGFFDAIRAHTSKIIMVSMARGNAIPDAAHGAGRHPTYPLIIKTAEDVRPGNIGLPQFIVKGEILKQIRFDNLTTSDDGHLCVQLMKRFLTQICFLPDLFTFGNYFEPQRFTNNDWKLKAHWELPIIYEE